MTSAVIIIDISSSHDIFFKKYDIEIFMQTDVQIGSVIYFPKSVCFPA